MRDALVMGVANLWLLALVVILGCKARVPQTEPGGQPAVFSSQEVEVAHSLLSRCLSEHAVSEGFAGVWTSESGLLTQIWLLADYSLDSGTQLLLLEQEHTMEKITAVRYLVAARTPSGASVSLSGEFPGPLAAVSVRLATGEKLDLRSYHSWSSHEESFLTIGPTPSFARLVTGEHELTELYLAELVALEKLVRESVAHGQCPAADGTEVGPELPRCLSSRTSVEASAAILRDLQHYLSAERERVSSLASLVSRELAAALPPCAWPQELQDGE